MDFAAVDESFHTFDPDDWSWNESWFFSWIDLEGGPAGVFRVGITPNQSRAMLWSFLYLDGAWITVEESRLAFTDFDLAKGVRYDKWGLSFHWRPEEPFVRGQFTFEGVGLVRSGPRSGARVPFSIDLNYSAAAPLHGTALSPGDIERTTYPTGRFEQSLVASGHVVVDGRSYGVRAGAHRDKTWGPRDWRHNFALGDVQAEDRQLFFAGMTFPGYAGGYQRHGNETLQHFVCVDGNIDYDDAAHTIKVARLVFEHTDGGDRFEVIMEPIAPSFDFDIAHTCPEPEHWLYWRTMIEANIEGWDAPARGWFEAGRYGVT